MNSYYLSVAALIVCACAGVVQPDDSVLTPDHQEPAEQTGDVVPATNTFAALTATPEKLGVQIALESPVNFAENSIVVRLFLDSPDKSKLFISGASEPAFLGYEVTERTGSCGGLDVQLIARDHRYLRTQLSIYGATGFSTVGPYNVQIIREGISIYGLAPEGC